MTEETTTPVAMSVSQPINDRLTKPADEYTTSTSAPQGPAPSPAAEMSTHKGEQPQIATSSTTPLRSQAQTSQAAVPEEPQSSLTRKFLETEWTALREFRAMLPDVFAKAFLENPKARDTPVMIWGISIDPANPAKDARVSVILMKFLRARNLNSDAAAEMLINTLRWRESFNIDAALKEEYPQEIFGKLGHNYGHDKGGRPVTYNIYGGNQDLKAVFGDVQRFLRWRVAMMENCIGLLDFREIDQCLQVHDYEGVSLTSRDANSKSAASEATNIFQSHYPEMLYKKFFINVPTILNWIFWAFKSVLSSNTMAKMSVVGTGHHAIQKALLPYIDAKQLPKKYGGEADTF